MGGAVKSAGGFLGLGDGPKAPDVQAGNQGLDALNQQNAYALNPASQEALFNYANGNESSGDVMNTSLVPGSDYNSRSANAQRQMGLSNQLATGATTGSKFASEQVQNNPILGSLFGKGGQLEGAEGKLNDLQSQGFELKPEDMTLYGQTSGNIARMFGAQGNQISQDLANRGLASAPSGAAGAMFSGLNGNQNEMLAQAQQGIMQQRFQNTMQQIGQQQNFINSLGQQAGNDINQQYGRQLSGANTQKQGLESAAGLQAGQNQGTNSANMAAANFNVANTPTNFMDAGIQAGTDYLSGGMSGKTSPNKNSSTNPQLTGNKVTAASTADDPAMYSDRRLKTDIVLVNAEIREMLDGLTPYSFRYSDKSLPEGKHYGIMAQDLEGSAAGKSAVVGGPLGKAIDINKAVSLILASLANINTRLSALEK